jgi:MoxR-like ATPase
VQVPTIDTVRHSHLILGLIRVGRPTFLYGPMGSGKTMLIKKVHDPSGIDSFWHYHFKTFV